jgi:hypothetical protein
VIGLLLSAVLAAAAPAPAGVDRDHGVRFDLSGRMLTVSLLEPTVQPEVWGRRVRAACSPRFVHDLSAVVHRTQLWRDGQSQLTYTFTRDVSAKVKWCLIEDASGGGDIAAVQFEVFIPVVGERAKDRRIGRRLRRYLLRNAGNEPWLEQVTGILVDRGVIAVSTELRPNRRGKRIARVICDLIQGSDVADFTPGHTVFGRDDVGLRVCRARRD